MGMKKKSFLILAVLSLAWAFKPLEATPLSWPAFDNPPMDIITHMGNTVYVGGNFYLVGNRSGCGVVFDKTSGLPLIGFPEFVGTIYTAIPDGGGGWFVGGNFSCAGGQPFNNAAHVLSNGSLDTTWNPNPGPPVGFSSTSPYVNGNVHALALNGGTLYIGGEFHRTNGQNQDYLAALDAATGNLLPWNPHAAYPVFALAVSNGIVYVGQGNNFGGSAGELDAVDAASGALSWSAGLNDKVEALAVSGTTILAAGNFTTIGGQPRSGIAAWDMTTHGLLPWNPQPNFQVYALAVSGNTVYLGGYFQSVGGQPRSNLAAVDLSTGALLPWNPAADYEVFGLAVDGGTVYAGGTFFSAGGQSRTYLAALDASMGTALAWNPVPNNFTQCVVVSGNNVFAGGSFSGLNSSVRSSAAAFDSSSDSLLSWDPQCNDEVEVLLPANGVVYAAGRYSQIGGQARNCLAALDPTTGTALPFNPNVIKNGAYGVKTVNFSGTSLFLGGSFVTVGGQPRSNLAAVDATTGNLLPWNPSTDGPVLASAVSGGIIYLGGIFSQVNGQPQTYLAAVDATGNLLPWRPVLNGQMRVMALSGNTLYIGGDFATVGGQPYAGIAAVDATSGNVLPWNPVTLINTNIYSPEVWSLSVSGGYCISAGSSKV
jgi:trimeric autotransporter adhesin